jgi:hypothetical protein
MSGPDNKATITQELTTTRGSQEALLHLVVNDKPLGHIYYDAAGLSALIEGLSNLRAAMADEIPRELDPGSRLPAVVDPIWRIPEQPQHGGKLLALRHPGLGWIGCLLPIKEARAIAHWLLRGLPPEEGKPAEVPPSQGTS